MHLMVMTLGVPMAELTMEQNFVKGVHTTAFSDVRVRIKGRKWGLSQASIRSQNASIWGLDAVAIQKRLLAQEQHLGRRLKGVLQRSSRRKLGGFQGLKRHIPRGIRSPLHKEFHFLR